MKILCVADQKDLLVYSENIGKRYGDVDLVISAGDLPLRYYEFIVSSLNKNLYFVFGNHHAEQLPRYRKMGFWDDPFTVRFDEGHGGIFIDGKVKRDKLSNLIIAGLGGSMRYSNQESQYTETQMFFRILKLIPKLFYYRLRYKRFLDILVTHAPPRGIGDQQDLCHRGFKVFLWFMKVFKPRYLLHGHIHLFDLNEKRVNKFEETTVVNVYGSYILEIE